MNQLQQAKPQTEQIAKSNWLSQDEKKIIKVQFFPPNATDMDMIYCMKVAETFNLNPILKQIFFVERSANIDGRWITKIEPLAGRDSFLTLAHRKRVQHKANGSIARRRMGNQERASRNSKSISHGQRSSFLR